MFLSQLQPILSIIWLAERNSNWPKLKRVFHVLSLYPMTSSLISDVGQFWRVLDEFLLADIIFLLIFGGHKSTDNPCFGLLVTSPLGFKARVGNLIYAWQRHTCYSSMRFTTGVTPADLLAASMAAKLFSSTYL